MKNFIFSILVAFISVFTANAQSIEFHQSYGTDNVNAPYGASRVIGSYFWVSPNEKHNVFTWNAFDRNATNTLLYTEHQIGKSNFYVHPEVRFDYWYGAVHSNTYDFKPMLGFSYLIPWKNGAAIYLTPKVMTTYDNVSEGWSKADLQFSVNSSYENKKAYYEGYIDTNWFNDGVHPSIFTEQKAYYKMTDHFQVGGSVVFTADENHAFAQPYLSFRVAL